MQILVGRLFHRGYHLEELSLSPLNKSLYLFLMAQVAFNITYKASCNVHNE